MGAVIALEDIPEPRRAIVRIRKLLDWGYVTWEPGCDRKLAKRGLSDVEIVHLIQRGRVTQWVRSGMIARYKIVGPTPQGEKRTCIVEMNKDMLVIVAKMLPQGD